MKLEDFVKQTLLDITNGVAAAQLESPLWVAPGSIEGKKLTTPQMVAIEVSVTTSKEGGGSINIWSAASAKAGVSSEQLNRISFEVPVYFQARRKGDGF